MRAVVERMLKSSGQRLDLSSPFVDAALPDGSRLHVVIPDVTRRHWSVNIRKFVVRAHHLEDLVRSGSLSAEAARYLDASVDAGLNILVSGATQAGKTTLLNCLSGSIGSREQVVRVEEVFVDAVREAESPDMLVALNSGLPGMCTLQKRVVVR